MRGAIAMSKRKLKSRCGFTLIELMAGTVLVLIVISAIGGILVDSQRGFNAMYNRMYLGVAADSYVARKTFDSVVRKSSREKFLIDPSGSWLEVYYYASVSSTVLDRYARFYTNAGDLNVEYGSLDPEQTLNTDTICPNVSSCVFRTAGRSAQMILNLEDGSHTATVTTSAVMHNE